MNHWVKRRIAAEIQESSKSVLLLGPRQTGKSSLLLDLKPDRVVNLAHEEEYLRFSSDPGALERELEIPLADGRMPKLILIDEIQRVPNLLNTVQVIIDRDRLPGTDLNSRRKFLLSGSSARKLKREGGNLLPGRVFIFHLGPLIAAELDYQMDTTRALAFGTLPEVYLEGTPDLKARNLRGYAGAYLREEIQSEASLRNLQGFGRFLMVIARYPAQILDQTKLAKEARVSRNTIPRYFELLEDTLIAQRVFPWTGTDADLIKHPRVFFFDVGVVNGLLGNFIASEDRKGFLFEQLFYSQVRASAWARGIDVEVSSFRTRGGTEVDFVVEVKHAIVDHSVQTSASTVWMIELKASLRVQDEDSDSLVRAQTLARDPKQVRLAIAYLGDTRTRAGKVEVYPWQLLLKEMGL